MANLELIKSLNAQYGKQSPFTSAKKSFSISEAFETKNLEKSIQNSIADLGPKYTIYFNNGKEAEVVLLFIDVCNFSTRYAHLNGEQIGQFFDRFYDKVIPIIYEYNGEIDKIIGDGIICIFGEPFLSKPISECIKEADKCAKKIISNTKGTEFSSKIAFHFGKINYFKNKSGLYNELTVIGKPLTELFRLESVSKEDRINYFIEYRYAQNWNANINTNSLLWQLSNIEALPNELKGVKYSYFQTNQYLL